MIRFGYRGVRYGFSYENGVKGKDLILEIGRILIIRFRVDRDGYVIMRICCRVIWVCRSFF